MIKKMDDRIQAQLKSLPETGMGFQVVEATYFNNDKREILVINGSILLEQTRDLQLFEASGFVRLSAASQVETNIKNVDIKRRTSILTFSEAIRASRSMGANDSSEVFTENGERFIRFSAFGYDDFRLNRSSMSLSPGTYAAPFDDAIYCLENSLNINDRYALPNNYEIKFRINVRPLYGTPVKRGIVQPANGWQGGGKEVIFTRGTDPDTVTSVELI